MATIKNIAAVVNGTSITGLFGFAVGETVNFNLTCLDPNTQSALNLTALAVVMTIDCYDTTGKSIKISRQATITNAALGQCTVPISNGDTYVSASSICYPRSYACDIWAEDVPGNRIDLGYGTVAINPMVRTPNAVITPLPSQVPLAQGPAGAGTISVVADVVNLPSVGTASLTTMYVVKSTATIFMTFDNVNWTAIS